MAERAPGEETEDSLPPRDHFRTNGRVQLFGHLAAKPSVDDGIEFFPEKLTAEINHEPRNNDLSRCHDMIGFAVSGIV